MPRSVCAALLCAYLPALELTGCSHAMCDPRPVGEPWKPLELLLPVNTVVCGPNRINATKPSKLPDNYGPEQVFVFYRDADVPTAFDRTLKRFEDGGWTLVHRQVYEAGAKGMVGARVVKGEREVTITVNRNDSGVQGSFTLRAIEPSAP